MPSNFNTVSISGEIEIPATAAGNKIDSAF
jgi:hypothetical protein